LTIEEPGTSTVEIVVKLAPHAAPGSRVHKAMLQCASDMGITLEPVSLDTSNAVLASYHVALIPKDKARKAVEQLRHCEGVEAAYVKPRGEPPTGGM